MKSKNKQKRTEKIMKKMGYIPHPGLPGGRAVFPIKTDGNTRPILYVEKDSPMSRLTDPIKIQQAYEDAQKGEKE